MLEKFNHHRERRPEPRREDGAVYRTARWLKLRRMVLSRQPVCVVCCNALATEVDHINGVNTDMRSSNLQSLCKPCHSRKTVDQWSCLSFWSIRVARSGSRS
jgi:5-methylcytosine-specific restriction endonuclease McrA